jgi:L,D-transpeptidase-like protein
MAKTSGSATRVAALRLLAATAVFAVPSFTAAARTVEPIAPVEVAASAPAGAAALSASAFDPAVWAGPLAGGIDPRLLSLALEAAGKALARGDAPAPATLTVIDFSKPSTERRLWVFDVRSHALLFHEYVAHGRGSGENLPTVFSNLPESNQSSLGLFRTGEAYIGKHGYSLRLDGLERGINDRARERAIVIHGADYVNAATARAQGRLGRSLGCPAVRPEIATPLISAVKDGGLLFAYYPEQSWLHRSSYLN